MVKRLIEYKRIRKVTFNRRMRCVKKKTMELSTLCGISTCILCFGPAGKFKTWPENPAEVRSVIDEYRFFHGKHSVADAPEGKIERVETEIDAARKMEKLRDIARMMSSELDVLTARIEFLNRFGKLISSGPVRCLERGGGEDREETDAASRGGEKVDADADAGANCRCL